MGDLLIPAERLAREEHERSEKRRQDLAEQRSNLNSPEVRIRTWERVHQLRMPSDPAHPILDVIAVGTRMGPEGSSHERFMKFALSAPTRKEQVEQLRQDRALAPVLRTAFPTVQHLRIELRFQGSGPSVPTSQTHMLYPPARAFFEHLCPYADCDGQFDLEGAVRAALAHPTHRAEGVLECHGSRGQDPASRRACLLQLTYEVTATYQQPS
jgi:hypothetical protein